MNHPLGLGESLLPLGLACILGSLGVDNPSSYELSAENYMLLVSFPESSNADCYWTESGEEGLPLWYQKKDNRSYLLVANRHMDVFAEVSVKNNRLSARFASNDGHGSQVCVLVGELKSNDLVEGSIETEDESGTPLKGSFRIMSFTAYQAQELVKDPPLKKRLQLLCLNIESPVARKILAAMTVEEARLIAERLGPGHDDFNFPASLVLAGLGKRAVPILAPLFAEGEEEARALIARILGAIGEEAASTIPLIVEALNRSQSYKRQPFVEALLGMGSQARAALPVLVSLHKQADTDGGMKCLLGCAVVRIGANDATTVEAIDSALWAWNSGQLRNLLGVERQEDYIDLHLEAIKLLEVIGTSEAKRVLQEYRSGPRHKNLIRALDARGRSPGSKVKN